MRPPVGVKEEPAAGGAGETQQSLKKGPWTAAEDAILVEYVRRNGEGNWNAVQKNSGLQRCGKSCRLRWANHLRPNLKKGSFSPDEEALILQLHAQLGNKWARMAAQLPGRTDNEIKNYWNTRIKRRQRAGLPLYPPEIQRQMAFINQRQGSLMLLQNPARPKNFLSPVTPTQATLFCNAAGGGVNYLLGNFELNPPPLQTLQTPTFSIKMELPSTQLFPGFSGDEKPRPHLVIGQGSNGLMDALFQESEEVGELFNEGLFLDPLPAGYATMSEPPPSSKFCGIHVKKQPTELLQSPAAITVNNDLPGQHEMIPLQTTVAPTATKPSDWCNSGPSSIVTEEDLRVEMQQLASNLSMSQDWGFGSGSWDNMPGIR